MHPRVGLAMDEGGSLIVTYECARCEAVQKRAYRLIRADDVIKCDCGASAVLDAGSLEKLRRQVDALRQGIARLDARLHLRLERPLMVDDCGTHGPSSKH
jgi:hypothetical protein